MDAIDPLHGIASRCSDEALRILKACRGSPDFQRVVEMLEHYEGRLDAEFVGETVLALVEPANRTVA
jgi:hypothetical protein